MIFLHIELQQEASKLNLCVFFDVQVLFELDKGAKFGLPVFEDKLVLFEPHVGVHS